MRTLIIVFASCALSSACGGSDASTGNGQQAGSPDPGAEADGGSGKSGGKSPEGADDTPPANKAALDVVVNEVAAVGSTEWIELANKGQSEIDLTGHFVADSDKATNAPKKSDAMRFPAGTKMKPGERIVILTSKKQGTVGPHPKAECLPPDGPETCFYASFGVSATNGESIHVLAPDGSVITSTAIPKTLSADAGGSTTETQCRLPDLTGSFGTCAPTPGAANRAP